MEAFKSLEMKKWVELLNNKDPAFRLSDIPAYIDAIVGTASGAGIDDRKMLLEKGLVLMSRLGDKSDFSTRLQERVIDLLYKDLPHPQDGYLSLPSAAEATVDVGMEGVKYAYRSADGSNYNPLVPLMGRTGRPYARTVPSTSIIPPSALPDAGLVFDTLLKRDRFVKHPGGISSLFFGFADLVIHSIFNTDHHDWSVNKNSSYLDLSILYGSSQAEVESVRKLDGTGQLHNDVFADSRLLFMPPSACALLVLLSRNHNYIAKKLLDINERKSFHNPPPIDKGKRRQQDDELFHRARLVNCGYFMQIILGDYVGSILGLARDGHSWRLNPLKATRSGDHEVSPRGEGNVVSIEFNLLYRWHATLSEQDTKWTEELFKKLFNGKDPSKITVEDFKNAAHEHMVKELPADVKEWTFDGLKRGEDGNFNDDDLAKILLNATEWYAGSYKAAGTPEVLRVIEVLGIEQARSWGACSLNEFRKFMGLKPYANFKEWNPDKAIYTAAESLYKDIDNLELHVGLQAEESKPPIPGAGLCPGYTISRAILADAVCLTRGDRFLTTDFTPYNFTSWGYQDCQFDPEDGSYGGMLTKMLFRFLPDHYPAGSAYAHFPFLVPSYMLGEMKKAGNEEWKNYTWTRPAQPKSFVTVTSFAGVSRIVKEPKTFVAPYNARLTKLAKDPIISIPVQDVLVSDKTKLWQTFSQLTQKLILDKSINRVKSCDKFVDIVGDVINLVPVYWIAHEVIGIPLTTEVDLKDDDDVFEIKNLHKRFADVCEYVYLNFQPDNDWKLRSSAQDTFNKVTELASMHLAGIAGFSIFDKARHAVRNMKFKSHGFLKQLAEASASSQPRPKELAAALFAEVVPTSAHFSQSIAHVVNFYLDDARANERKELIALLGNKAAPVTEEARVKVMGYVREALRLDPIVSGVYRTSTTDTDVNGVQVQAGATVFASVSAANLDPSVFGENPASPSFTRPKDASGILGLGEYGLLSSEFFEIAALAMLSQILPLKNLGRAPGASGHLTRFTEEWHGTPSQKYISMKGQVQPWPDSLVVEYSA
ncbi:hypothetical protein EYR40_001821 [Pleurotus pulmonarius]|nr:hypothetical protein EYR40_001821 [Pleurotus pulmonarius]